MLCPGQRIFCCFFTPPEHLRNLCVAHSRNIEIQHLTLELAQLRGDPFLQIGHSFLIQKKFLGIPAGLIRQKLRQCLCLRISVLFHSSMAVQGDIGI